MMTTAHLLFFFVTAVSVSSRRVNFYRRDYVYFDEHDAFYKLHIKDNLKDWNERLQTCDNEGAEMFYPRNQFELPVVKKLLNADRNTPNVTEIYVGMHDTFGLSEFVTVDGQPTPLPIINDDTSSQIAKCVVMNVETGALRSQLCHKLPSITISAYPNIDPNYVKDQIGAPAHSIPFICRKIDESQDCPTIDKEYKYVPKHNKCYKVNKNFMTWANAMETCFMEGGILLVIKNNDQYDIIGRSGGNKYFVGFKKLYGTNNFFTVTGTKLEERLLDERRYNLQNECGIITDQGIGTESCENKMQFICEMPPKK